MSDQIILTGISDTGYHGVFPEERVNGQLFIVDVVLDLDLVAAGNSDHLINTVDYSKVAKLAHDAIIGEPFSLIEKLGEHIALAILDRYSLVRKVVVTVHKPDAPVGVSISDIAIKIERTR
ncbi:MAG: dihydroneopterin aldolase [Actinomycetes bacterium]